MRKKNKAEGLTLPDFKLYYEAVEIKTDGVGIKRHIDDWDRTEGTEINAHIIGQLDNKHLIDTADW